MPMKQFSLLALLAAVILSLSACSDKGLTADLKAAEEAIAAAKTAQVDPANADLKNAEDTLAKAKAEITAQQSGTAVKDYAPAKALLAQAKLLSEKALADHKAATAKAPGSDADKNVTKFDPPRIKS